MPRGDGTGPMGMGPMTGRAAGYCAGYGVPGFMNPYGGRGPGMAWGRGGGRAMGVAWGRGWGRGGRVRGWGFQQGTYPAAYGPPPAYFAPPSAEEELEMLGEQADWLKEQIDSISARIQQLVGEAGVARHD